MSVDTKERMDDLEKLIQRFSDAEFSCGEAEANTEEFTEALRGADVAERNLRKYVHTLLSRLSVLEGALRQTRQWVYDLADDSDWKWDQLDRIDAALASGAA